MPEPKKQHIVVIEDDEVFKETYCEQCDACVSEEATPFFCFYTIYKDSPAGFDEMFFDKLRYLTPYTLSSWEANSWKALDEFADIFCTPEVCSAACLSNQESFQREECVNLHSCLGTFLEQVRFLSEDDVDNEKLTKEEKDEAQAELDRDGFALDLSDHPTTFDVAQAFLNARQEEKRRIAKSHVSDFDDFPQENDPEDIAFDRLCAARRQANHRPAVQGKIFNLPKKASDIIINNNAAWKKRVKEILKGK